MKLKQRIIGTILVLGLGAFTAQAEELSLANYMAPTHFYVPTTFDAFAQSVADLTDGEVTVRVFSGGELGAGPTEQYSRAVDGVADIVVGLPGYTASAFPRTLLTELPGVLKPETGTQTLWDNIDLLMPEYSRAQLVALWSNAPNLLYTRSVAVRTLADVKGLNIRVPSVNAGYVVESWGGTPVSMPVSEIYNALQTGVIDGALIDGTATNAFKLGEVAAFITTGLDTTISPFYLLMNRDSFARLSTAAQDAVLKAGREASINGNRAQLDQAEQGLASFTALGKEVIALTPEEAAPFNAAAATVVDRVIAEASTQGIDAAAIIAALKGE